MTESNMVVNPAGEQATMTATNTQEKVINASDNSCAETQPKIKCEIHIKVRNKNEKLEAYIPINSIAKFFAVLEQLLQRIALMCYLMLLETPHIDVNDEPVKIFFRCGDTAHSFVYSMNAVELYEYKRLHGCTFDVKTTFLTSVAVQLFGICALAMRRKEVKPDDACYS